MKLDEKKWQKLVQAFREKPGNILSAAKMVPCDRDTAKRAWLLGYPDRKKKPIQVMLEEEEAERAAKARMKAEVVRTEMDAFAATLRGDLRSQALEDWERTNRYLRAASATATATLVAVHRIQPAVNELAELAPELVGLIRKDIESGVLNGMQAVGMLDRVASVMKMVSSAAASAATQGAKVFEITKARGSADAMLNIDKAVGAEPFDPAEAKRLAAELAEAALEVEMFDGDGKPLMKVIAGEKAAEGEGEGEGEEEADPVSQALVEARS